MSGIAGYVCNQTPATSADQILREMGRRLTDRPTELRLNRDSAGTCGMVAAGSAGVLGTDALYLSWEGRPYWSDPELQQLQQQQGPATAMAAAYRRYGADLPVHLHGPVALALHDAAQDFTLLAIDRLGIRPLAFTQQGTRLAFASRLDALRLCPGIVCELAPQGIYHYLYHHVVPSPGSIYRDVHKLLPGQCIRIRNGQVEKAFYWQPAYSETDAPMAELAGELHRRLEAGVEQCLDAAATGAFLSGGLDSSTVTGLLGKVLGQSADAYTIGFHAEGYDETPYARASAEHFGARLHSYYVTPDDVVAAVPLIARAYDEPFGNSSAVPAYYCALRAKEDGKGVLLAGDGGDEIFGGNARYAKQQLFDGYHQVPAALRSALEPLLMGFPDGDRLPLLRKARSYIAQARIPMPDRLETYNFLHRTPLDEMLHPELRAAIDPEGPICDLRATYARPDTNLLKRMLYLDLKYTLADNDLRKVNRMCDLADIEVRYPMLDEELVAFSARIPSRRLMRRMELRSFYKQALRDFLPPQTLSKHKHGFGLPFGLWLQDYAPLRELAYDSLLALKKRCYLNPAYLDQLIEQHRTGHASYYGVFIWVLMMMEQWLAAHPVEATPSP